MAKKINQQVQFSVDEGVAEAVKALLDKAGMTPSDLLPLVYEQILNTGQLPADTELTDEDVAEAKIIAASHNVPVFEVNTDDDVEAFFNDDGGY
jgi:DNA-damage-inducible protein J